MKTEETLHIQLSGTPSAMRNNDEGDDKHSHRNKRAFTSLNGNLVNRCAGLTNTHLGHVCVTATLKSGPIRPAAAPSFSLLKLPPP